MEPEAGMGTRLKYRSKGTSEIMDKGRTEMIDKAQTRSLPRRPAMQWASDVCRMLGQRQGCKQWTDNTGKRKDWVTRSKLQRYLWFHRQMVQVMAPGKAGQGPRALRL